MAPPRSCRLRLGNRREKDAEAREAPLCRRYADLAAELLDEIAHDVHAHAAAGILGDAVLRGESRHEDQRERAPVIELRSLLGAHEAALHRGLAKLVRRQAAAVVLADELETLGAA